MLFRSIKSLLVAVLLLGAVASPALSQTAADTQKARDIRVLLEQRDREIKALLQKNKTVPAKDRETLKAMVNGIIDFNAMAQAALGPHWASLSAAQRNDFVDVFSEIVRTQSLSNLDVYRSTVSYDRIDVTGTKARVATSVTYKDVPTRVDYLMTFANGQWRVNDIILDEVSTAEGYARSFQPVVKQRGFDTLMASLRKKLDKVAASGT
jgi:phospholipid transport system substrate-binding protein